jgi:hypothetical protein
MEVSAPKALDNAAGRLREKMSYLQLLDVRDPVDPATTTIPLLTEIECGGVLLPLSHSLSQTVVYLNWFMMANMRVSLSNSDFFSTVTLKFVLDCFLKINMRVLTRIDYHNLTFNELSVSWLHF